MTTLHWIEYGALVVAGVLAAALVVHVWRGRRVVLLRAELNGNMRVLANQSLRVARRLVVLTVGVVVVLAGVVMLVAPGPGVLAIVLGLAILATEFVWARRWLKLAKQRAEVAADRITAAMPGQQPVTEGKPSFMRRMLMKVKIPGDVEPAAPAARTPPRE